MRVAPRQLPWLALSFLVAAVKNMKQFGILRLMP